MDGSITLRILGDFGPFSRMGKSISYLVTVGSSHFMIDCGAPLFQQMGGDDLQKIKGVIITHCHDDHKRWFTDLALFHKYASDVSGKIFLLTSEDVHRELKASSSPALDRSLSTDSRRVVDISYEDYVDVRMLGPRARYRIARRDDGGGRYSLVVHDSSGSIVGPETAKVVVSDRTGRARLLFRDPQYGEWVEPESFYPFSSGIFYEEDRNRYDDPEGFSIEALKAPAWHGISGIGLRISTASESLFITSDLVHDRALWERLWKEKREQRLPLSRNEFAAASVLVGDINDYIERTWSKERYDEAIAAFDTAVTVHDVAAAGSVVHTDYEHLLRIAQRKDRLLLTHCPDLMTSEWVLCDTDKSFRISGGAFCEIAGNRCLPMNADIYHKEGGSYFVGYRNREGAYQVREDKGVLSLSRWDEAGAGRTLYRVDIYQDIGGRYLPKLEDGEGMYLVRTDGRVERITFTPQGSTGVIVEDQRDRLSAGR